MTHIVLCTRHLTRQSLCVSSRLLQHRYATSAPQLHTEASQNGPQFPKYVIGGAGLLLGLFGTTVAFAKENDEDVSQEDVEEAMDSNLADELNEMANYKSDDNRIQKWMKDQDRFLLLDAQRRSDIQIRDSVTPEELAECDELYDRREFTALEDKLILLNTHIPNNAELLWRLSRLKWEHGIQYDSWHQHKIFHVAHNLLIRAVALEPDNGTVHRWKAIIGYHMAAVQGTIATILNMEGMKYHLERALEIDPSDYQAWTLLGNWYFEVAELTWLNKKFCHYLAGSVPTGGSYEKALECFNKSEELSPTPWCANTLFIAKTHLRMSNVEKALPVLEELSRRTIITVEDFRVRKEAHLFIRRLTKPTLVERARELIKGETAANWRLRFSRQESKSTFHAPEFYKETVD